MLYHLTYGEFCGTTMTKEEVFDHFLLRHGPDCRVENRRWFGGCNSPEEGFGDIGLIYEGDIIPFDEDSFNQEFQRFVEERCEDYSWEEFDHEFQRCCE